MKRHLLLVIILNLFNFSSFCQFLNIEYDFGYGAYSLKDLKLFQSELIDMTSDIHVKQVTSFPNYSFNSGLIDFKISERGYLGLNYSYLSTGARNHYADYSGELKTDFLLTGNKYGVNYKYIFPVEPKIFCSLQMKAGFIYSKLNIDESITINNLNTTKSNDYNFKSRVFFLEPIFGLRYFIIKNVGVNLNIGYELNKKSQLSNTDEKALSNMEELKHPNGEPVYLNWSGARISAGVTIAF